MNQETNQDLPPARAPSRGAPLALALMLLAAGLSVAPTGSAATCLPEVGALRNPVCLPSVEDLPNPCRVSCEPECPDRVCENPCLGDVHMSAIDADDIDSMCGVPIPPCPKLACENPCLQVTASAMAPGDLQSVDSVCGVNVPPCPALACQNPCLGVTASTASAADLKDIDSVCGIPVPECKVAVCECDVAATLAGCACNPLKLCAPLMPKVVAGADIGSTLPATPYLCTGTHEPASTGTVGGSVKGGLLIEATVSASATFTVLQQYDFACDYGLIATAYGYDGLGRRVRTSVYNHMTGETLPAGMPCAYDGIVLTGCETDHVFLADQFSGSGIAGPAGWGLPTQVTICPPDSEERLFEVVAHNEGQQDVPDVIGIHDFAMWECRDFAIHYTI